MTVTQKDLELTRAQISAALEALESRLQQQINDTETLIEAMEQQLAAMAGAIMNSIPVLEAFSAVVPFLSQEAQDAFSNRLDEAQKALLELMGNPYGSQTANTSTPEGST